MDTDILGEFLQNTVFWTSVISWATAQTIKVCLDLKHSRRIHPKIFFGLGGMPSSHTAFVVSMSFMIGFVEGFGTSLFALAAVTSMIVMVDAAGVRRAAGKQAAAINDIFEILEEQGVSIDQKLKELLGHSPIEVAVGAILGFLVALLANFILF